VNSATYILRQVFADKIFASPSADLIKTVINPTKLVHLNIFFDATGGKGEIKVHIPRLPPLLEFLEMKTQYAYYDGNNVKFGIGAQLGTTTGISFR